VKTYGGVEVWLNVFLTWALAGGQTSASCSGRFTTSARWTGDWMGPRVGMVAVAKRKNPFPSPAGNRTPVIHPVLTI